MRQRIDQALLRADLVAIVGRTVKLRKTGREYVGLCPFHQETTPSFTVVPEKGFWHCFGCSAHGDALRFLQEAQGHSFMDALAALDGETVQAGSRPIKQRASVREGRDDGGLVTSLEAGIAVSRVARPARGTIVETYLRHRGIDPRSSGLIGVVQFLSRCPVSLWRRGDAPRLTAPAMLAPICHVSGEPGARVFVQQGVHVTYLAPDGRGKARLPSWFDREGKEHKRASRKIWGEAGMGCVPIPPPLWGDWHDAEWLGAPGELVVGEGIESTHSLLEREARRHVLRGALATLSLGNLQGGWLENGPRVDGAPSLQLWNVQSDPENPPFTVPAPGAVAIGVDADMKGLTNRRVQERPRARAIRRDLTGDERTTLCGQLAAAAWRRAGASHVRVLRPRAGHDFNDEALT
ncbi:CHC2 zinc finger domain-containing protein [Novosphingobium kaempferiae]|uniref:CHC2 zinc finger domain-containing protein n=1 Tax=Novosphingobium kaempferiae TaxID=2896849 RepID=UPI001E3C4E85|nr:CHC2 zinc finger domain-containing protein [Novosphingobium kaempferiae]